MKGIKVGDLVETPRFLKDIKQRIDELDNQYYELRHELNVLKASGDTANLANLEGEFDETFDGFLDEMRNKYWPGDEDAILKTNKEVLNALNDDDLLGYVKFYDDYISDIKEEIQELRRIASISRKTQNKL